MYGGNDGRDGRIALRAPLPYRREAYRLWYEALRLARASADPEVRRALGASAAFYAPWGDTGGRFDAWWKDHARLFEERYQVRRLGAGEAPADPDALVIEVPLTAATTELARRARAIIREARAGQERDARRSKSKRRPTATYRLTEGSEPKLRAVRDALTVYRDVYMRDPRLRGKKLLDAVHAFYAGRKKSRRIPMPLEVSGGDTTVAMRNLRRYIQRAERIVLNAARGEFPGRTG
jgi:hypothetical protein